MNRVRTLKTILWTITGFAAAVALTRFTFGLGATTNLTDAVPWGFWIGFDVMGGVALAAGGFVLTAFVYIFKRDEFHPIVRPAVLTAFLGYLAVIVGLLFDLGLPWNIWHMIVWWNPHSPLFEVGWCVMLYTTVLMLEFMPVPLEGQARWARIRATLSKLRIPLVIVGISLSTLHQSSLGTLFTIMPYRLHPLWYTPILPILFFLSAVMLGLFMVTFESETTAWVYRRKPETSLLAKLNRATPWVIGVYLAVRFVDLAVRGQLQYLTISHWQTTMFWIEILLFMVLPLILLALPKARGNSKLLWTASWLGVFGVVLNRINTGGLMHQGRGLESYLPSWTEITLSVGVVSAAMLVFLFAIERFHILEERPLDPEKLPAEKPQFDPVGMVWLGSPEVAARTGYSLAFVLAAGVGMMLLSGSAVRSEGFEPTPVRAARGGDTLYVDGNHDGYGASFTHKQHAERLEAKGGCAICHHMNLPRDEQTPCAYCHNDQYLPSDAFGHDWHASPKGANLSCMTCHPAGDVRSGETAAGCDKCHADLFPAGVTIEVSAYTAPAYTDAMHRLCIECHEAEAQVLEKENLPRCVHCHTGTREYIDAAAIGRSVQPRPGVVLPSRAGGGK